MDPEESLRRTIHAAFSSTGRKPPLRMQVLYEVDSSTYAPTGRVTHRRGGAPLAAPHSLAIVKFESDFGYYLLRRDGEGAEITDTYHDSIDHAFAQAEAELGIPRAAWTKCERGPQIQTLERSPDYVRRVRPPTGAVSAYIGEIWQLADDANSYGLHWEFILPHTPEQNDVAESFMGTLKLEFVWQRRFETYVEAKAAITAWVTIGFDPRNRAC